MTMRNASLTAVAALTVALAGGAVAQDSNLAPGTTAPAGSSYQSTDPAAPAAEPADTKASLLLRKAEGSYAFPALEGVAMTLRKVGNSGVTDIKSFYALFPGKPLKFASKIAGLPKPVGCI